MAENLFTILGVHPAASQEQISASFRKLSREMHPDAGGDELEYQVIVDAYNALKSEKQQRDYIKWLELTQEQCPACKGLGIVWKQRGFTGGESVRCAICRGGGYYEPKR